MEPTIETPTHGAESVARQIEASDFEALFVDLSPSMMCHDAATQD